MGNGAVGMGDVRAKGRDLTLLLCLLTIVCGGMVCAELMKMAVDILSGELSDTADCFMPSTPR